MNTVRHPAAPTEADVALSDTIRRTCGQALCAGLWPRDTLVAGMRLTEDMDEAMDKGDTVALVKASRLLMAMAPDHVTQDIHPRLLDAA